MMIDVNDIPGLIAKMVIGSSTKTLGERMLEEESENLRCAKESDSNSCDNLNVLQEAQAVVDGQRLEDYGDLDQSFLRIAGMWSGYLGVELDKYDVAHMMIMLKLSRVCGKFHRDSYVDAAGYAYCAEKMNKSDLESDGMFRDD